MIALVVLPVASVAAAALVYGIVGARRSHWAGAPDRRPPILAAPPLRLAVGSTLPAHGRHRHEDAHTGSLSATAILHELNAQAGGL